MKRGPSVSGMVGEARAEVGVVGGHGESLGGESGLEVSILLALPCRNPSPFSVLEGAGDQSQRRQGREQPKGRPYQQHAGVSTCVCAP